MLVIDDQGGDVDPDGRAVRGLRAPSSSGSSSSPDDRALQRARAVHRREALAAALSARTSGGCERSPTSIRTSRCSTACRRSTTCCASTRWWSPAPHRSHAARRPQARPRPTSSWPARSTSASPAFAAGPKTEELLAWWSERLATDCLVAPERGYFVDQRWMDFAPGLVPGFFILRDPGYNLAYWNLAGARPARRGNRYEVDGRPLRFFHFSGFDPERPHMLSKHQDRIQLSEQPVLLGALPQLRPGARARGARRVVPGPTASGSCRTARRSTTSRGRSSATP